MNRNQTNRSSRARRLSLRARFRRYWGKTERKGSVLIVVLGLLLLLMLIGFTFFTFSTQEHSSAEYYADAAKVYSVNPNSDVLFDWALDQLIIGPYDSNAQSVLWPGDKSLVPRMLGIFGINPASTANQELPTIPLDRHPFNGTGVNVISSLANGQLTGVPFVDQNHDGIPDNGQNGQPNNTNLLYLNTSPAAQIPLGNMAAGNVPYRQQYFNLYPIGTPAIDAGYTYPDINSPYLAYVGNVPQNANGANAQTVITPTFHRPQYLRYLTGAQPPALPAQQWYLANNGQLDTTALILRPHPNHVNVADGQTPRYLSAVGPANALGVPIQPFPFAGDSALGLQSGIWMNNALVVYDVDNDNDGVREGVWVDLNFPMITLPDGRKMIPLFSYTVQDADALINLNAAGNVADLLNFNQPFSGATLASQGAGVTTPISRSNLGMSPSEINPWWALVCDPNNPTYVSPANNVNNGPSSALQQYRAFFARSNLLSNQYVFDRTECGNADGLFLLWGRPAYSATLNSNGGEVFTLNDLNIGRYGDASALLAVAQSGQNGNPPSGFSTWPVAGAFNTDDDGDMLAGLTDAGDMGIYQFPLMVPPTPFSNGINLFSPMAGGPYLGMTTAPYVLPFGQPLDFTGVGQWTAMLGGIGQVPNLTSGGPANPTGLAKYLTYINYQGWQGAPVIPYEGAFGGNLAFNFNFNQYGINNLLGVIDEPDEMVNDVRYQQPTDQMFAIDEVAALQLSQADYLSVLGQSRVRQLAPLNFELNLQAATIRRHFTTASEDRKNHSFAYDTSVNVNTQNNQITYDRRWEYGAQGGNTPINNWDGSGSSQFPPMAIGNSLDGQAPINADTRTTSNNGQVEPFRMEVAALVGAKVNNNALLPLPSNNTNNAFLSSPYTLPLSPSQLFQTYGLDSSPWHEQMRYNINRFLTAEDPYRPFGSWTAILQNTPNNMTPTPNPLRFRELTPHPTAFQWANGVGNPSTAIQSPPVGQAPTGGLAFPTPSSGTSFNNNPQLQEFWARRDRQQLARDIYVMLYMFGGGQDSVNYATTPNSGGNVYFNWQLAEMAQFAVNYVDALDRDDVITKFEYDTNLADGWNLDDDPMTADVMSPPSTRGVVYGTEAQQLAFSEALLVVAPMVTLSGAPSNITATIWDDRSRDRYFTYLELFNVSPSSVNLSGSNWQIALLSPGPASLPVVPAADGQSNPPLVYSPPPLQSALIFKSQSVAASQFYSIGSRTFVSGTDDQQAPPYTDSNFVVNAAGNSAPTEPTNVLIPATVGTYPLNLDLVQSAQGGAPPFTLIDGNNAPITTIGGFVDYGTVVNGSTFATNNYLSTFVLRRRLNLERPAPQVGSPTYPTDDADNPWIEVDRITYQNTNVANPNGSAAPNTPGGFFNLRDPNDPSIGSGGWLANDLTPKLQRLTGWERRQPLDGYEGSTRAATLTPPNWNTSVPGATSFTSSYGQTNLMMNQTGSTSPNTIGSNNYLTSSKLPNGFTLWQPHFDRDFSSVMELLSVPLYPPYMLTASLNQLDQPNLNALAMELPVQPVPPPPATTASPYFPLVAQSKFMRPLCPNNALSIASQGTPTPQFDNRWYRILELLEVPTRENIVVENFLQSQFPWLSPTGLQRIAAKINLNTLRQGENLFALLDDPNQFGIQVNQNQYLPDGSYQDLYEPGLRNWWFELVRSRDGIDPTISQMLGSPVYVPGSPVSRPFRPFSFFNNSQTSNNGSNINNLSSLDDTLFRGLPHDTPSALTMTIGGMNYGVNGNPNPGNPLYAANMLGSQSRRLFEARAEADLTANAGFNQVDHYTRQRLLAKIAGNTTQRSNVFLVWVTVGFFEVYQPNPANNPQVLQIGAELTDQTRRRGFFVVDRTLLEDAWIPNYQNPSAGYYDFKKFIQYRKTIQ